MKHMFETIYGASRSDSRLAALVNEAGEYAKVYLLAKQRHRGYQGTSELMTLKEEFKDTIDKMVRHCKEKEYVSVGRDHGPDFCADILNENTYEKIQARKTETADICLKSWETICRS